jgi:hypothetical protein
VSRSAESHYHTAAVCRSEALVRLTSQPGFAATLAKWADNAQRRGDDLAAKTQRDLFA